MVSTLVIETRPSPLQGDVQTTTLRRHIGQGSRCCPRCLSAPNRALCYRELYPDVARVEGVGPPSDQIWSLVSRLANSYILIVKLQKNRFLVGSGCGGYLYAMKTMRQQPSRQNRDSNNSADVANKLSYFQCSILYLKTQNRLVIRRGSDPLSAA